VILPRLEAAVDNKGGGEDAQENDHAPNQPGNRGLCLGPEAGYNFTFVPLRNILLTSFPLENCELYHNKTAKSMFADNYFRD
jgi:hypothetical protein